MPDRDPPPADFEVSRAAAGGGQVSVFACRAHLAHTRRVLEENGQLEGLVTVGPANVDGGGGRLPDHLLVHGCKGHMAGWPAG